MARRGDDVVKKNCDAIDIAISGLKEVAVPEAWLTATTGAVPMQVPPPSTSTRSSSPSSSSRATSCPYPRFNPHGFVPTGTTQYEKRGIAVKVPEWIPENCIQCGNCSLVCPHGCIRPFLLTEEQAAAAPESFKTVAAKGKEFAGKLYRIQVSPLDCTGCGNCVQICLAKTKALDMKSLASQSAEEKGLGVCDLAA